MSCGTTRFTESTGTANPTPADAPDGLKMAGGVHEESNLVTGAQRRSGRARQDLIAEDLAKRGLRVVRFTAAVLSGV